MEVYCKGKGAVTLTQNEFRAQGGEGSVYVKGGTAYKIYADPKKMIAPGKIQELSPLSQTGIIKPQDVLLDKANVPVGYTMRALADAVPLCTLFPRAYRDRCGLTPDKVVALVQRLRDGVQHCHDKGILIVDLNEMNFLVRPDHQELYFIDVDSYQTAHFPATALMDSVRDRHAQSFGPLTDWFSFGIVSFQLFVGLHPYKGKHPKYKTLDERMQKNVSVFHKDVGVPAAALPLDVIPQALRDWYQAVFERGLRVPPPNGTAPVIVVTPQTPGTVVSQKFHVEVVLRADGDIIYARDGLVVTTSGVYVGGRKQDNTRAAIACRTPKLGRLLTACIESGLLRVRDVTLKADLPLSVAADALRTNGSQIYLKQGDGLFMLDTVELPATTLASLRRVGNVAPQATQLWDGCAIQNLMGTYYASLLPDSGKCYQVRLPEVDGCRILNARFEGGVLVLLAEKSGIYDRWVLRFDPTFTNRDAHVTQDVGSGASINFTVLDTGVALLLNEIDEIEVFSSAVGGPTKRLQDASLTGACLLFKDGAQALFARGPVLSRFTQRQP